MSSHPSQADIQTVPIQAAGNEIETVPKFYRAEDGSLQPIPHGLLEARAAAIEEHRKLKESGELGAGTVFPDPETAEEFNAFPINPDYVLASNGWPKHRITVQYAFEKELREKLGVPAPWEPDQRKIRWHKEQLARLEKADAAPRCAHIYADGTRCRGPRLKNGRECYAHTRMKKTATRSLALMPVEDANDVVVNIMEIHRALCDDEITERRAGLLLYGHQLALTALHKVSFKETDPHEMVREIGSGDLVIGGSGDRTQEAATLESGDFPDHEEIEELEASGDLVIGGSGDRIVGPSHHREEACDLVMGASGDRIIGSSDHRESEISGGLVIGGSGDPEQEQRALASGDQREAEEVDAGHERTGDVGNDGRGMECAKSNEFGDEGDGTGEGCTDRRNREPSY